MGMAQHQAVMLDAPASLPLLPLKFSVIVFLKAFLCLPHQLPTTTAPFLFLPLSFSPAPPLTRSPSLFPSAPPALS